MQKYIPPVIFCPRCGEKISLRPIPLGKNDVIQMHGYDEASRGMCRCGVVLVICHQPLPKSPSFSIFIDVYKLPNEVYTAMEEKA